MSTAAVARPERDQRDGTSAADDRTPGWRLSPGQRKLALSAHVLISVGLFGVYAAMLLLAVAGAMTADPASGAAAYRAMAILKDAVPPGAIGVIVTGVLLSLGTSWGLFKHLWVVVKLVLTVAALPVSILLVFPSVRQAVTGPATEPAPVTLVAATALVALMLGAATVIAVYKPWGLIPGRRRDTSRPPVSVGSPS